MKKSMSELRELCKKSYYNPFQKKMHEFILYVTRPLLRTSITPNQITISWLILQFIAAIFMLAGTYKCNVIGIILFTVAMLLDYIDGQIARIKKISTYKGIFLEELGIYFGSPIFFLFFSIGVAKMYHNLSYALLGIISSLSILYSKLAVVKPLSYSEEKRERLLKLKNSLTTRTKKKYLAFLTLIFRRSNPLNFMFFGIIFGLPRLVLVIYTLLYVLEVTRRLSKQLITLHKLDKKGD